MATNIAYQVQLKEIVKDDTFDPLTGNPATLVHNVYPKNRSADVMVRELDPLPTSRTLPSSGDTLTETLLKITKYLSDTQEYAYTSVVDSTNNTSTDKPASASAVKTTYDLANQAKTNADNANNRFTTLIGPMGTDSSAVNKIATCCSAGSFSFNWVNPSDLSVGSASKATSDATGTPFTTKYMTGASWDGKNTYGLHNANGDVVTYIDVGRSENPVFTGTLMDIMGLKIEYNPTGLENTHAWRISENIGVYPGIVIDQYSNAFKIIPTAGDQTYLGTTDRRYQEIWATHISTTNAVSVTSDKRDKDNISEISDKFANEFVDGSIPSAYILKSGADNKIHYGFIAQEIETLVDDVNTKLGTNIDSKMFAPLVKTYNTKMNEDKSIEEDLTSDPAYSLRYEEFIPILFRYCQSMKKNYDNRISTIEQELTALKNA